MLHLLFWEGELDVYAWLKLDLSDVEDLGLAADELNDSLVDSHLVSVPGLGTLTTRGLSGGDAKSTGWHRSWSLDLDRTALINTPGIDSLSTADDLVAGLVDRFRVLSAHRDTDVVFCGCVRNLSFFLVV